MKPFHQSTFAHLAACVVLAATTLETRMVKAELAWAAGNGFASVEILGFNDLGSITGGGSLDFSRLPRPDLAYSVFGMNSITTCEAGGKFHVKGCPPGPHGQEFEVYVLARMGGIDAVTGNCLPPPPLGTLQVQMRSINKTLEKGSDANTEIPVIAGSQSNRVFTLWRDIYWLKFSIRLPTPALEDDYWFTISAVPAQKNTFDLIHTPSSKGAMLFVYGDGCNKWINNDAQSPMMVISQYTCGADACTLPQAHISAPDAGQTSTAIVVDGTQSFAGSGASPRYAWSVSSRPPGSNPAFGNPDANYTTFSGDKSGDYVIQFTLSTSCGNSSISRTLTLTNVWNQPTVGVPFITPDLLHARDESTYVTLSVAVTDPNGGNPDYQYAWMAKRRDVTHTGPVTFSTDPQPNVQLLSLVLPGLQDRGTQEDTFYDISVKVTDTKTHLSTTSPSAEFGSSRWPKITYCPTKTEPKENQVFEMPFTVNVETYSLGILMDANSSFTVVDFHSGASDTRQLGNRAFALVPGDVYPLADWVTLSVQVRWDTGFCERIDGPAGSTSSALDIALGAEGMVDENGFDFGGPIVGVPQVGGPLIVEVPDYKIKAYYNASYGNKIAAGEAAVAVVDPEPLGKSISAISAGVHLIFSLYECEKAHDDPPGIDPDFGTIVTAAVPDLDATPAVAPDGPSRLGLVAAENALRLHAEQQTYDQTFNKLFGAYQALNPDGAIRQGTELIRHGAILDRSKSTFGSSLLAAQRALGPFSEQQYRAVQQQVARSGFPASTVKVLRQLGANQAQVDYLGAHFAATDPALFAQDLPADAEQRLSFPEDSSIRQARVVVPGDYVLVAVTDPVPGQRVRGAIPIEARVVHKKEGNLFCLCGPTLATAVLVDGQPMNVAPLPPPPWCPPPSQPYPQAVPVQLDSTRLPDGLHTITVIANDACLPGQPPADPREHTNSDTITILVDNSPPTLAITAPDADPNTPGIQVLAGHRITYQASDPTVGSTNSGLVDPFQGVINTAASASNHVVTIRVADRSGNVASATVTVLANPGGTTIPTLSEWGLMVMALLLLATGALSLRRVRGVSLQAGANP